VETVLVASLGDSPAVVTAMVDLLYEQTEKSEVGQINKVVVLCPKGDTIKWSYDLVEDGLQGKCQVECCLLPFDDANGEEESFKFLRVLYQLLAQHQALGDVVYLSLAGGRKNMSALMALLVPLFPCVKKLYHVIDLDEDTRKRNFVPIEEMIEKFSEDERKSLLHPNTSRLRLIDIPYGERQRVSDEFRSRLFTITDKELDELWEKDAAEAEATQLYRSLTTSSLPMRSNSEGRILRVFVTEHVKNEYQQMCRDNVLRAKNFAICFEQMRIADNLAHPNHLHGYISGKISQDVSMLFHYYKRLDTAERPFYYTWPEGIHRYPHSDVHRVIICGLAVEREGKYEPEEKVLLGWAAKPMKKYPVETLFPTKSILLVPLGTSPMVATQLYTLLREEEGRVIQEVRLIYPERSNLIRRGVRLLKRAFSESDVACLEVPVKGLKDIASSEDCLTYQKTVEQTIQDVQTKYPDCQIDLALSGGRKGMAALTMFVAQQKRIRYVYHTLINDEELYRRVTAETEIETLDSPKVSNSMVNNRLFLQTYDRTKFALFKVPVLAAGI
jgi:CRISPR-associated Csx14 family protein